MDRENVNESVGATAWELDEFLHFMGGSQNGRELVDSLNAG